MRPSIHAAPAVPPPDRTSAFLVVVDIAIVLSLGTDYLCGSELLT
jgi:hypothetical protein